MAINEDSYYPLRPNKGKLLGLEVGVDDDVLRQELIDAEKEAKEEIDSRLGKRFNNETQADVPFIIARIAHRLAAGIVWESLDRNAVGQTDRPYSKELKAEARQMLQDILNGDRGIKLADGSWDQTYPGRYNREQSGQGGGSLRIISG